MLASYRDLDITNSLRDITNKALDDLSKTFEETSRTTIQAKLFRLRAEQGFQANKKDAFINLSSYELTSDEKELLNLGLNCHYYPKRSQVDKKAQLELLYQQICDLHTKGKIDVNTGVQELLQAEGTKRRGTSISSALDPRLRKAAKQLRDNNDIVIRRADKSSIFVILDRDEYFRKWMMC